MPTASHLKPDPIYKERNLKLVEALESGNYKQARGALHRVGDNRAGYCCLGVACDIHRLETNGPAWDKQGNSNDLLYLGRDGTPANEVAEWFGWLDDNNLVERDPVLNRPPNEYNDQFNTPRQATELNDQYQLSFEEIAAAFRDTFGLPRASQDASRD